MWSGATLRQAEATGDTERCQCSWKLDSSTARTSYGSGCSTASSSGVPTLPALVARSPAARRIEASMLTVVVLPLVPVTVSQGAAPTRGAHPPGQLDLAPHRYAGRGGRDEQRAGRGASPAR